jgi:hypothetical protein
MKNDLVFNTESLWLKESALAVKKYGKIGVKKYLSDFTLNPSI